MTGTYVQRLHLGVGGPGDEGAPRSLEVRTCGPADGASFGVFLASLDVFVTVGGPGFVLTAMLQLETLPEPSPRAGGTEIRNCHPKPGEPGRIQDDGVACPQFLAGTNLSTLAGAWDWGDRPGGPPLLGRRPRLAKPVTPPPGPSEPNSEQPTVNVTVCFPLSLFSGPLRLWRGHLHKWP